MELINNIVLSITKYTLRYSLLSLLELLRLLLTLKYIGIKMGMTLKITYLFNENNLDIKLELKVVEITCNFNVYKNVREKYVCVYS